MVIIYNTVHVVQCYIHEASHTYIYMYIVHVHTVPTYILLYFFKYINVLICIIQNFYIIATTVCIYVSLLSHSFLSFVSSLSFLFLIPTFLFRSFKPLFDVVTFYGEWFHQDRVLLNTTRKDG